MRRPTQPVWYSLVAILVCVLAVTIGAYVTLDRSAQAAERAARAAAVESEQRWCAVIATIDEAYRIAPPATEISRKLARDIRALREQFDCP